MLHPIQRNENSSDAGAHLKRVPEENGFMIESSLNRLALAQIGSKLRQKKQKRNEIEGPYGSGGQSEIWDKSNGDWI
ncbi:hypothetical protein CDL15_Pgr009689 [Punica granatum]|uniref:Uncharacterized protein n=1 Tax=Punica granatum TaxID=22663 RepID=A0A218WT66_PUNGR|nr:hypothetical protein CDL15_Pgr009689 [Punica granatum]